MIPNSDAQTKFQVRLARTSTDLDSIRILFTSYASWLDLDLTFQNFSHEVNSLPGLYSPPNGCLLIAILASGEAVGCVALRPLSPKAVNQTPLSEKEDEEVGGEPRTNVCEVKRLYTTEGARGLGIGKALVEAVIAEAGKLGYDEMKLDTLPRMANARRLYEHYGFKECEKYYDTPLEGTMFLCKRLA